MNLTMIFMLFDDEREEVKARDSLLRHYSSECLAHGAYILSFLVVLFTFLAALDRISFPTSLVRNVSIIMVLSVILTGLSYSIGRLFFWSNLTAIVVDTPIFTENEAKSYLERRRGISRKEIDTFYSINTLSRLSYACNDRIRCRGSSWVKFFGMQKLLITTISLLILWIAVLSFLAFIFQIIPA
jgi:hypothetical protein